MKFEGKTIIELHDAETGRLVKRTEDKNMLTNALTYFYKQGGLTNPSAIANQKVRENPLYHLLGGIFLLDTAITESAEIVNVPTGVRMIANGASGVVNTGNPNELGSWNENESGWMNDGSYKMVYDWGTSQGNGTIACVGLTSYLNGYMGIGNGSETAKAKPTQGTDRLADYNTTYSKATDNNSVLGYRNNILYKCTNTFTNLTKLVVSAYKFPMTEIAIKDTMSAELVEAESFELDFSSALTSYLAGSSFGVMMTNHYFDGNRYAYILLQYKPYSGRTWGGNTYVLKVDLQSKTLTEYPIDCSSTFSGMSVTLSAVTDTHIVLANESEQIMVNITNTVDQQDITFPSGWNWGSNNYGLTNEALSSKRIKVGNGDASGYIDLDLKQFLPINWGGGEDLTPFVSMPNPLFIANSNVVYRDMRYLATINNLEEPVTKDASKTMKVTYVIRFS